MTPPKKQVWRVKIYTLGTFTIEKDGQPLTWIGKAPARPLTLLKVLIACGGEARESDLTDALWPEALGDAAHKSLSVTLTRLRQILGVEGILEYQCGCLHLNAHLCWTDVWTFETLLQKVEKASLAGKKKKLSSHSVGKLKQAFELYQGHFLQFDSQDPWAIPMRARLHNKLVRLILQLGTHWEQAQNWKQAEHCYQTGLEIDETCEAFYHRWIHCLLKQGQRVEARRVFEQCSEILKRNMNADPGPEIQELTGRLYKQKEK